MILTVNSVNQLIFVMVKSCVFFAVRTEFLNMISASFGFRVLSTVGFFKLKNQLPPSRGFVLLIPINNVTSIATVRT
jgi:hypothetical protein